MENYDSSEDIRTVQKRFDEEDMPLDVLWLDIEYSENHKYFIWDKKTFRRKRGLDLAHVVHTAITRHEHAQPVNYYSTWLRRSPCNPIHS
jgi:alpha-glucosidase (family GH31 glycosyl hydrolase)